MRSAVAPGAELNILGPDEEVGANRGKVRRPRLVLVAIFGVGLLLSLVLPHIAIREAGYGGSLLLAGFYFLHIEVGVFPKPVNAPLLGLGFNTTYLGLALHELGLALGAVTFWVLAAEDINRWLWRLMVIGGWLLTFSAPFVIAGGVMIRSAGVSVSLGLAWVPALLSGAGLLVAGYRSKGRIDRTWYLSRPELM